MESTVEKVVSAGLCTQCGWCVAVCPARAISLPETPAGGLFPRIDQDQCTSCGLCYSVCSGWNGVNRGMDGAADSFRGTVLAAHIGHATDRDTRAGSQSGGVVTALLEHQLVSGAVQGAVVASMPVDGSLRPTVGLARDRGGLRRAGGSKYCPILFDPVLGREVREARQVAVVGVSCQVQTLRNIEQALSPWEKRLGLVVGLFCDRIMSTLAIDLLAGTAGCPLTGAATFAWRSKERSGWPGEVRVEDTECNAHWLPAWERIRIKDVLTPARCRVCFDKMNVCADIAVGDPHGIDDDPQGHSVVLARTVRGLEALQAAQAAGAVVLEPLEPERIFAAQKVDERRRNWTHCTAAWEKLGRRRPGLPFDRAAQSVRTTAAEVKDRERELRQAARLAGMETRDAARREAKRQLRGERISARAVLKRARRLAGRYRRRLTGGR